MEEMRHLVFGVCGTEGVSHLQLMNEVGAKWQGGEVASSAPCATVVPKG